MSHKDVPASPQADKAARATQANIRLLATTDLHAHLRPFDYLTGADGIDKGLARLASIIAEQRATHPNCLLLDNGDTFEGTPLAEFSALDQPSGPRAQTQPRANPMLEAMNALDYDAATLGNHDFNFGLAYVRDLVRGANFPYALCNIRPTDGSAPWPKSVILTRHVTDEAGTAHEIRIGIVGAAPPQIVEWDSAVLHGALSATGIEESAVAEARTLRASGQADIVIALAHSGIDWDAMNSGVEDAVVPLAKSGAFDAIVAGHTHEVFPDPSDAQSGLIAGTPVVQPGAHGSHLGVIDLGLDVFADGAMQVAESRVSLLSIEAKPPAPAIMALSESAHANAQERLSDHIGRTDTPLSTYFSRCVPCPTAQLISRAQIAAAKRLIAGHPSSDIAMVSAAAPSRIGGLKNGSGYTDIPVGEMQVRHSFDLCAYPNRLAIVRVDGAGLKRWIEHAAGAFQQIELGVDGQNLVDDRFPGYNFDTVFGVSYRLDITQPALAQAPDGPGRVRDLAYQGAPIEAEQPFLLVTSSYRVGDGGGFATAAGPQVVLSTDLFIRHVLVDFIRSGQNLSPDAQKEPPWTLARNVGATVFAKTNRAALEHADRAEALGLGLSGPEADGHARIAVPL